MFEGERGGRGGEEVGGRGGGGSKKEEEPELELELEMELELDLWVQGEEIQTQRAEITLPSAGSRA